MRLWWYGRSVKEYKPDLITFSPFPLYIMYVRVCVRGLNLFESIESIFRLITAECGDIIA